MTSELINNPAKSTDPEVLLKYFVEILGFTPEEAEPMVRNWARTTPQTMEEVEEGVRAERERRMKSAETWVGELERIEDGNVNGES